MKELDGKAIVVTGAGGGLGRAYALAISEAGGAVVVNDANAGAADAVVREIVDRGGVAIASHEPVGTAEAARSIVDACLAAFGKIDGLINNAGLHHEMLAWEEDPADAERIIRVNLLGTLHCGVAAMKPMREAGSGVIINIGSGSMLGIAAMNAYGCSKAAVMNLTTTWSKELAGSGVRVHAISPTAKTPMSDASDPKYHFDLGPDIVAPLAVFLLGDGTDGLDGRLIRLDQGRLSLFSLGAYGPALGECLDWTSDKFRAAFARQSR